MIAIQHSTSAAISFLARFAGGDGWTLTAIDPNTRQTTTQSFGREQEHPAAAWIEERQAKKNLYFSVNLPKGLPSKKAKKADIISVRALHVDVDPRDDHDLEQERERIIALLRAFTPQPSVILFSGGGYQAFWLLKEPVPVDDAERLEAYNKHLENVLGGDNCHNIDRIMRLPGTINIPDSKKRAKGRTPTLAKVVDADFERRYTLDQFPLPQSAFAPAGAATAPAPLRDGPFLAPGLRAMLDKRLPKGQRSEYAFKVIRTLIERGFDDGQIVALLARSPVGEKYAGDIERLSAEVARCREKGGARGFELTDVGNGKRFAERHGGDMLYCHPWKNWYIWDGRRFRQDEDGEAVRRAKEVAAGIYEEAHAVAPTDTDRAKAIAKHAAATQQKDRMNAMLFMAQSELPVAVDALDRDDKLLNLDNGTLDLTTLTLREHRREDLLTKLAPVKLDPNADCPTWRAFLERIYGNNRELIEFVQRAVGYSLTGETSEQVLLLLHGSGANGKSTLLEILLALLGDYARPTEFRTLLSRENSEAVRNDVAALVGLRLVTAVEVGRGKRLDEAMVKQITGGDTITARFLHKEFFDFKPRFKLWLAANTKPEIRGTDEGIWRRVNLVPHEVTIPPDERDRELGAKLRAELSGILNWCIEGLREWRRIGLAPPEIVRAATDEYRSEMDILGDFLDTRCVAGPKLHVSTGALYGAYETWCNENGEDAVKKRTFGILLKERGFADGTMVIGGRKQRVKIGLALAVEDYGHDPQAEMEM